MRWPCLPYQSDVDVAQANLLANPEDASLQAALATAQQALVDAEPTAALVRDASLAAASAAKETAGNSAAEAYLNAISTADDSWQNAIASAAAEYDAAEQLAWDGAYIAPETTAQQALVSAEQTAWDNYTSGLANLNSQILLAQSQYETDLANAAGAWQGREQIAWTTYVTALSAIPNAPDPGVRQTQPPAKPPLAPAALFAAQQRSTLVMPPAGENDFVVVQAQPPAAGQNVPTTVQLYMPMADEPQFMNPEVVTPPSDPLPPIQLAEARVLQLVGPRRRITQVQYFPGQQQNYPVFPLYPPYQVFQRTQPFVQGAVPIPHVPFAHVQGQASFYRYAYINNGWVVQQGRGVLIELQPGVRFPGLQWGPVTVAPGVTPPAPVLPRVVIWGGRYYTDFGPGLQGGIRFTWEINR